MSIILVIDEHGIYRRGLCSFIETHLPNSRAVEASNFDCFEADAFVDLILIGIEQVCIDCEAFAGASQQGASPVTSPTQYPKTTLITNRSV